MSDHQWPNCQCQQTHDALKAVLDMLGIECDHTVYVIGKAVQICEAIKRLQSEASERPHICPDWALKTAAQILKEDANRLAGVLDSKELRKYDTRVEDGVRAEMNRIRSIEDELRKQITEVDNNEH